MKVLITGASSGIGHDIAKIYYQRGYDTVLVSRNIKQLSKEFPKAKTISLDLSIAENCYKLSNEAKDTDILINNAGFGDWGNFWETDLDKERNMISLNVEAVHILTKIFVKEMVKKNRGTILNVASLAAFSYGPLMSTYYATKAYVYKLSTSIDYELRKNNKNVQVIALCPGPVNTGFNKRAGVSFSLKALNSFSVAKYAVKAIDNSKRIAIPGMSGKFCAVASRFVPTSLLLKIGYWVQHNKY